MAGARPMLRVNSKEFEEADCGGPLGEAAAAVARHHPDMPVGEGRLALEQLGVRHDGIAAIGERAAGLARFRVEGADHPRADEKHPAIAVEKARYRSAV